MMRALFVGEERDHLVVGAGVPEAWFENCKKFFYGPTATAWGPVTIVFTRREGRWFVKVDGAWRGPPPRVRIEAKNCERVGAQPTRWETPLIAK